MKRRGMKNIILIVCALLFVAVYTLFQISGAEINTVYLCDGGTGDGKSADTPLGDFKEAVRALANTGGKLVICGRYTYSELITLSKRSGTSNENRVITVTSVDEKNDYRITSGAALCAGNSVSSANMVLDGSFIFENLNIVTDGTDKARYIVCGGYDTVFGDGIVCKKEGKAPYLSIVGVSDLESATRDFTVTVKSGTYNNLCISNKQGVYIGNSAVVIDGGTFEGKVSAAGFDGGFFQDGNASLTVNGGYFHGSAGLLTAVTGDFVMTVNGGTFRKDIIALGKYNTVNINGGNLQSISALKVADYIPVPPETDEDGNAVETLESDVKKTVVNINKYGGDVKKLKDKIQGQGLEINVNTLGGSDAEITAPSESLKVPDESNIQMEKETNIPFESTETKTQIGRKYYLGSRERTIFAIVGIAAVAAFAVVMLSYRSVYRKK